MEKDLEKKIINNFYGDHFYKKFLLQAQWLHVENLPNQENIVSNKEGLHYI